MSGGGSRVRWRKVTRDRVGHGGDGVLGKGRKRTDGKGRKAITRRLASGLSKFKSRSPEGLPY